MATALRNGPLQQASETNQQRAARYEDEKARIIDSCFNKTEEDGALLESYITHIRVTEDAMYPSSPPPPESSSSNKKARLIIVAVRKSGKVRVHKARENPSGTFSIGKTWNLDELSAIRIYARIDPMSQKEQQEKEWSRDVGFVVTLGKPYYWHAATAKEKDFFIASLIKIYRKYTNGKVPVLNGFSQHQMEQMGGTPANRDFSPATTASPPPQQHSTSTPVKSSLNDNQSQLSDISRGSPAPPSRYGNTQALPPHSTGFPSPTPDPVRASPHLDRGLSSTTNLRAPSNSLPPTTSVAPQGQLSVSRTTPMISALTQKPSQSSLDFRDRNPSVATNTTYASTKGTLQSGRPSIGDSDYLPTTNGIQNRSISSLQQNDQGSTASSAVTPLESQPAASLRQAAETSAAMPPTPNLTNSSSTNSSTPSLPNRQPPQSAPSFTPPTKNDSIYADPVPKLESAVQPATLAPFLQSKQQTPAVDSNLTPKADPLPVRPRMDYFSAVTMPTGDKDISNGTTRPVSPPKTETTRSASPVRAPPVADPVNVSSPERTTSPNQLASPQRSAESPQADNQSEPRKKSAKEVADTFRKVALAANAFKPRQGGGAARLKAMQEEHKKGSEPDGITGVVPAPLLRGMSSDSVTSNRPGTPGTPGVGAIPGTPGLPTSASIPQVHLQRTATTDSVATTQSGLSPAPSTLLDSPALGARSAPVDRSENLAATNGVEAQSQEPERARSRSPQRRKRQKQEADLLKYTSALGIDAKLLEGRGADFNDLLTEFGWDGKLDKKRKVDDLETDIRREIGRAQAAGWLGHVEQQEAKVAELSKAFDKAIEECEELDGLFTLYSHELDTLQADIEYIEAQSQGLQVQTANQKLLLNELQSLLTKLTIPSKDLQGLQYGTLDDVRGIADVEKSLAMLYKALVTIDPEISKARHDRGHRTGAGGMYADEDMPQMRAVREKKDDYRHQSSAFVRRFSQHMVRCFDRLDSKSSDGSRPMSSNSSHGSGLSTQRTFRQDLWLYNAIMLFVKEVNHSEWAMLLSSYELKVKPIMQNEFASEIQSAKRTGPKTVPENDQILFTHHETEGPSRMVMSRKYGVKRTKTTKSPAVGLNLPTRHGHASDDAWESFQRLIEQHARTIAEEQNFIVQFFHASSTLPGDFAELISGRAPGDRQLPKLSSKLPYEPDRSLADRVRDCVGGIYASWPRDLNAMVDWVAGVERLQLVGLLAALEHVMGLYEDSNQEFMTMTLRSVHDRVKQLWSRFIDEQVRAIEETKVRVKKRKGPMQFMRIFPEFSRAIESIIPEHEVLQDNLEVRFIINDSYTKILKAMWDSLNVIARDSRSAQNTTTAVSEELEDKERLNHHVLLIENMNYYLANIDTDHNIVLEEWQEKASHDMNTYLIQYIDTVIRRPLGKWLDFVESTESRLGNARGTQEIQNTRSTCKKICSSYDHAEVKKGIRDLKERVIKHFDSERELQSKMLAECKARYYTANDRMRNIVKSYEKGVEILWDREYVDKQFNKTIE